MASEHRSSDRVAATAESVAPGGAGDPIDTARPDDLIARGAAAHVAGDETTAVRLLQRAHAVHLRAGDTDAALTVACLLAMVFGMNGQPSQAIGWAGRAQSLLDSLDDGPSAGRGYLAVLRMHTAFSTDQLESVGPIAAEIALVGRELRLPSLLALGLIAQGRHAIATGDMSTGLRLIDEGMTVVLSGEIGVLEAGLAWCAAIEGCQMIGAVDRLSEWTAALAEWLDQAPQIVLFGGECALHQSQVLVLRGAWDEASEALAESSRRYEQRGQQAAAGRALRELGDLRRLQGDDAAAEVSYRSAAEHGCDPQPGLALLWLGKGQTEAALGAVRRCLAETPAAAGRLALLPAAVEVLLAADEVEEAATLADELDLLARRSGCAPAAGAAGYAHAAVELARYDAAGALPYARSAVHAWAGIDCPFEVARSRLLLAQALERVGDHASSLAEAEAARSAFVSLGAAAAAAAAALLQPGEGAPDGLTQRELEVLRLTASGRSSRQIAAELVISEKTVARHLSNIFVKLGVGSRTEAAAYAFEHHLA